MPKAKKTPERKPGARLDDVHKERFCELMAQGLRVYEAAEQCRITERQGYNWNGDPDVKARTLELAERASTHGKIGPGYIADKALEVLDVALGGLSEDAKYGKVALDALEMLRELHREAGRNQASPHRAPDGDPKVLQLSGGRLRQRIETALRGHDQEALVEAPADAEEDDEDEVDD